MHLTGTYLARSKFADNYISRCSVQHVSPHTHTDISNLATSICPDRPVSGSQDALLCIPGPVSATIESFSLTLRNDVAPVVCIMRNTTLCGDIGEGEFDGIVIKLSTFSLSGKLEISGLLKVYYGKFSCYFVLTKLSIIIFIAFTR